VHQVKNKPDKTTPIILASNSRFRAELLKNAGIEFTTNSASIDERVIEQPLLEANLGPADIAQVLAEAKAVDVSSRNPNALIIGCDQTLSMNDNMFHKPADMKQARQHLLNFSGKTHQLNSAVAFVFNQQTIWRHVSIANMTMRKLSPEYIGRYLAQAGQSVLGSVGAYQLEGTGVQLFEQIEGDYFTIIGLSLLPTLSELRSLKVIDG
jgi:septum formation protein